MRRAPEFEETVFMAREDTMPHWSSSDITEDLTMFLKETFPLAAIQGFDDQTDLMALRIVDSFGLLELLGHIEGTYEIQVEDNDINEINFKSVSSMSSYILVAIGRSELSSA